jgi:hypothetical protein
MDRLREWVKAIASVAITAIVLFAIVAVLSDEPASIRDIWKSASGPELVWLLSSSRCTRWALRCWSSAVRGVRSPVAGPRRRLPSGSQVVGLEREHQALPRARRVFNEWLVFILAAIAGLVLLASYLRR